MNLMLDKLPFVSGDRLLFQGDSITDVGRNRGYEYDLGQGYVAQIRGILAAMRPDLRIEILNRGISGNRTVELLERWSADCLELKPQWLSIFIGVNDVWRKRSEMMGGQKFVPLDQYTANYRSLLDQAKKAGIANLVLISPTLIDKYLLSDLNMLLAEYDQVVQDLAKEYGAIYVPARRLLLEVLERTPEVLWLSDGCHPTVAGHSVIAAAWLQAVAAAASTGKATA